jgi:2-C-methyl-D-erythritol 4-phosphate cytidylyltransferase
MAPFHVVIPAAGTGSRMNSEIPKQYLSLAGRPIIEHTLKVFAASPHIQSVIVALSPDDAYWDRFNIETGEKITAVRCGGDSRAATVLNALGYLKTHASSDDWVLVHDAVRPGLSQTALARLLTTLQDDPVGGILAVPLADTLKRADTASHIARTEPRENLWLAQTPQMFRLGVLQEALMAVGDSPTDESQAVEALGLQPRLVAGEARNFKITYPQDLQLAEAIMGADMEEDA